MDDRWKTVDVLYKVSVLILLFAALVLLNDIRSQQQRTPPTLGDLKAVMKAAQLNEGNKEAVGVVLDSIPPVKVQGSVTMDK